MVSERMLARVGPVGQVLRRFSWTAALLLAACAHAGGAGTDRAPSPTPRPGEEPGTIQKVGSFGFGIVPDREPGTRYAPDRLPAKFRVDGRRVLFSGTPSSPPPHVRMWGTPFRLRSIRPLPPTPSPSP
jgi:hypothetical protein